MRGGGGGRAEMILSPPPASTCDLRARTMAASLVQICIKYLAVLLAYFPRRTSYMFEVFIVML